MSDLALHPGTIVRSTKRAYTIRRVLGQGGFGITYLVDTPLKMGNISFKAKFALKELFVGVYCYRKENSCEVAYNASKAQEVARFHRSFVSEAQRLQRLGLNHQHIVNVDEVFEANGTAYYVMEYLEGDTLENFVANHGGRLTFSQASALLRPICDAVAMLHANIVAHYDIKPQNIIIQQDEDGTRPVLIDFGLAKHYDDQGNATSTGVVGYSHGYAPLEQLSGLTSFSPATDVYALAATFVFCLTGHAPAKAIELNRDVLRDELTSLGVDFVRTSALLKAMALLPADRTPNAAAFRDVLFAVMTEIAPSFNSPEPEVTVSEDEEEILQAMEEYYAYMEQVEKSAPTPAYRTEPRNLDLQAIIDGRKVYFSVDEWRQLTTDEQSRFEKVGVVIDYNGRRFVTKLNMERHGSGYTYDDSRWFTWDEAMQWFNRIGGGWQLPSKEEGEAMAKQGRALRATIIDFGGHLLAIEIYWTRTEYSASRAWSFDLSLGYVRSYGKSYNFGVRGVRAI